jgi:hypothetical protein
MLPPQWHETSTARSPLTETFRQTQPSRRWPSMLPPAVCAPSTEMPRAIGPLSPIPALSSAYLSATQSLHWRICLARHPRAATALRAASNRCPRAHSFDRYQRVCSNGSSIAASACTALGTDLTLRGLAVTSSVVMKFPRGRKRYRCCVAS